MPFYDMMLLQKKIAPHVEDIKKSAAGGNEKAKQISSLYGMCVRYPEHAAATLCECTFDEWLRDKK